MLALAGLYLAAPYFGIVLLAGLVLLFTARGSSGRRTAGWLLTIVGGIVFVPFAALEANEALVHSSYMRDRCKAAVDQVPPTPIEADGFVILRDADSSFHAMNASSFVDPTAGKFSRVQEIRGKWITEHRWIPDQHGNLGHPALETIARTTMRYRVETKDLTTETDKNHAVMGGELRIVDGETNTVVARRVQFIQLDRQDRRSQRPTDVCPKLPPEEPPCDDIGACSPGTSVIERSLRPRAESAPPSERFHLYRGMQAPRVDSCLLVRALLVGPGIQPKDVEWWADGQERWEDLHLRVRGTSDEIVCTTFFHDPTRTQLPLRFVDGHEFVLSRLAKAGRPKMPKQLE